MRSRSVYLSQIDSGHEHFFFGGGSACDDFSGGSSNKALAPKFDALFGKRFMPDAIGDGHVAAIGDGMATLHRLPRIMLTPAKPRLF